jgi:hypothetical protein
LWWTTENARAERPDPVVIMSPPSLLSLLLIVPPSLLVLLCCTATAVSSQLAWTPIYVGSNSKC